MAGWPSRREAQGKAKGQRAEEQRETAMGEALAVGEDNPVLAAMMVREQAYDQLIESHKAEEEQSQRTPITDDQCLEVISLMEAGLPLLDGCKSMGYSFTGIYKRIMRTPTLKAAYDAGREMYAHAAVERTKRLAMIEPDPQRARLLIDILKWETSKVLPKFYGDKINVDTADGVTFQLNLGAPRSAL